MPSLYAPLPPLSSKITCGPQQHRMQIEEKDALAPAHRHIRRKATTKPEWIYHKERGTPIPWMDVSGGQSR